MPFVHVSEPEAMREERPDRSEFVVELPSDLGLIEAAVAYLVDRCRAYDFGGSRLNLNFRVGLTEALANRLTVLVQREVSVDRVRLIERILELEAPVHLQTQVVRATHPFIVGLASLVGVDTFLRNPVTPPALRVDESTLGGHAFLRRPPSLDPRLEGGGS